MSARAIGAARYIPSARSSAIVLLEHALTPGLDGSERQRLLVGALNALELHIGTEAFGDAILDATSRRSRA